MAIRTEMGRFPMFGLSRSRTDRPSVRIEQPLTCYFPEIREAVAGIAAEYFVPDGELFVLREAPCCSGSTQRLRAWRSSPCRHRPSLISLCGIVVGGFRYARSSLAPSYSGSMMRKACFIMLASARR